VTFEEFRDNVTKAFDEWVDTLFRDGRQTTKVSDLKEKANDQIESWKSAFPQRQKEIVNYIRQLRSDRFQ